MTHQPAHQPLAALRLPEIRFFLGSVAAFTLASRALVVIIGLQVDQLFKRITRLSPGAALKIFSQANERNEHGRSFEKNVPVGAEQPWVLSHTAAQAPAPRPHGKLAPALQVAP